MRYLLDYYPSKMSPFLDINAKKGLSLISFKKVRLSLCSSIRVEYNPKRLCIIGTTRILQPININMSTSKLKNHFYHQQHQKSHLQTILKARTDSHSPISRYSRRLLTNATYEHYSQSPNLSRPSSTVAGYNKSNDKLYYRISGQLKTIKEAITSLDRKSKQKLPKRKQKTLTQMSVQPDKNKIYQQILKKIQEIKIEKRRSIDIVTEEKTLFYGSDYISGLLFKIKIKLSGSHYRLYCKNNHAKGLLEMKRDEYKQINNGVLQGNPCNILKYLVIEDNNLHLKLKFKNSAEGRNTSVKSYFNYY